MVMVIVVMLDLANVMKGSMVTVAQVNMIICYWCFHLVVCPFSWFFDHSMFELHIIEKNSNKYCKNIS